MNVVFLNSYLNDVGLIVGRGGENIEAIQSIVCSDCRVAPVRTAIEVMNSRR
jgi:hypothetical protein